MGGELWEASMFSMSTGPYKGPYTGLGAVGGLHVLDEFRVDGGEITGHASRPQEMKRRTS